MWSKRLNLVWMLLFQQVVFLLLTFFSCSDLVSNLWWVPQFSEKDPEIFISLFERVARCFGWPDVDSMVMLAVRTDWEGSGGVLSIVCLDNFYSRQE